MGNPSGLEREAQGTVGDRCVQGVVDVVSCGPLLLLVLVGASGPRQHHVVRDAQYWKADEKGRDECRMKAD